MANNLKKRINIRVDDATFQLLERLSAKRGESISSVARRILSKKPTVRSSFGRTGYTCCYCQKSCSTGAKADRKVN